MARDNARIPSSTAGITSYFGEYKSNIEIKPGHVVIFCILVIMLVIALRLWGASLIGLP